MPQRKYRFHDVLDEGVIEVKPEANVRRLCLELTTKCNLSCAMYVRNVWEDVSEKQNMSSEIFHKILNSLQKLDQLREVHLGGFGEPLCHPRLFDWIKCLKDMHLRVGISTNSTLINEEVARELVALGVDRIVVSVDSLDEREFSELRSRAQLDSVLEGIHFLHKEMKAGKTGIPRLEIEAVLSTANIYQLPLFASLLGDFDLSCIFLTHLLPHSKQQAEHIMMLHPMRSWNKSQLLMKF